MATLRILLVSKMSRRLIALLVVILVLAVVLLALSLRRQQLEIAGTMRVTGQVNQLEFSLFGIDEWARETGSADSATQWNKLYASYLTARKSTNLDTPGLSGDLSAALEKMDALLSKIDDRYKNGASPDALEELRKSLDSATDHTLIACGNAHAALTNLTSSQASKWQILTLLVLISCVLALLALGLLGINQILLAKRLHTEQTLRQREARFAVMVQKSSDIITLIGKDGTIQYQSPSIKPILGYEPNELVGTNGFERTHPEDRHRIEADLRESLEFSNGIPSTYRFINREGEWRWLESLATDMTADESVGAIVVNSRDVTERQKYQKLLLETNAKVSAIIQASPLAIVAQKADGEVTIWNPAARRIFGWSEEEVVGLGDPTVFDEESSEKQEVALNTFESKRKRKDGTIISVQVSFAEMRGTEGEARSTLWMIEDITERKTADQSLRDSEDRLRTIIELEPECVKLLAIDGRIMHMNAAGLAMVEAESAEQVLGKSVFGLIAPHDRTRYAELIRKVFEGDPQSLEFQIVSLKGRLFSLDTRAVPIKNSSGVVTSLLALTRDVTQRKAADDALRASEERFSKAFNLSPRPMSITSVEDGKFIAVNDRFLKTCGYSREELIGKNPSDLKMWAEPKDREAIAKMVEERGSIAAIELSTRNKGGETLCVQVSADVIELEGQKCLLATYEDITRRKRAEEEQSQLQAAVQKSALEWRLTFDAVDSPILLLDVNGNVVRLNRAAKDLSGKSYWEIKGKPIKSIRSSQPWLKAGEMVGDVSRSRGSLYNQVKDGDLYKTWDILVRFFSASGTDDRIIVVARDITPTVALQESLRRSETMSAMGALVAGVAHEVRNPLFSVSATIDAFEARFGEREEHQRYISVLRRELDRLNQLMQDLLEYGRPSKLEVARGYLSDAILQAISSCTALAERAKVKLENRAVRPLAPVMLDRGRIVQVFQNLIENAIQHSPPGSTVTVEAEEVRKNEAVWVNCVVRDVGTGFREEDLSRIFEPFFTRRRGGTGLGLSIVQRIVEEHGGRIYASNNPGGGAAMGVTFQGLSEISG